MAASDSTMTSAPFFPNPMNVSSSSSTPAPSFKISANANQKKERTIKKRTPRKQRCLDELDQQSQTYVRECYELDQKKELWKHWRLIDTQLGSKYVELATKHKDIDIIMPHGLGRFKFQPAVIPSTTPNYLTTPNKLIKTTLPIFLSNTLFRGHADPDNAAETFLAKYWDYLTEFRNAMPKTGKKNAPAKIPKDGFKFTPPKTKKRKQIDSRSSNLSSKRTKN